MAYQFLYLAFEVHWANGGSVSLQSPVVIAQALLILCSLERCICRNEPSHLLSCFLLFSLLNPVHASSLHRCTAIEGAMWLWSGSSLLHVNIYFSLCLLISHICTQLPFCYSMFYFIFPQILAIIDLGLFSHLFLSLDTVTFPCPRIYIIDLPWSTSLWQMFLFQFQLDWLWFAGQFESWQAPKWLLVSV